MLVEIGGKFGEINTTFIFFLLSRIIMHHHPKGTRNVMGEGVVI
jgi:hypothetical protein